MVNAGKLILFLIKSDLETKPIQTKSQQRRQNLIEKNNQNVQTKVEPLIKQKQLKKQKIVPEVTIKSFFVNVLSEFYFN